MKKAVLTRRIIVCVGRDCGRQKLIYLQSLNNAIAEVICPKQVFSGGQTESEVRACNRSGTWDKKRDRIIENKTDRAIVTSYLGYND